MHPTDVRKQGIAQVRVCDTAFRKELQKLQLQNISQQQFAARMTDV